MTFARVILLISALTFGIYGLICLADPSIVTGFAGIEPAGAPGWTELRAMYGGLEAAFGFFLLIAFLRQELEWPGLLALAILTAGLASGRIVGLLTHGGADAHLDRAAKQQ